MTIKVTTLIFITALCLLSSAVVATPFDCKIEAFPKIIIVDKKARFMPEQVVLNSTCPIGVLKKYVDILAKFKGQLRHSYIQTAFANDFLPYRLKLTPSTINISHMKTLLSKQFGLSPKKWRFSNIQLLTRKSIITLNDNESITFSCKKCNTTGEKNITGKVENPLSVNSTTLWFTAVLKIKSKVLKATSNHQVTNKALRPNDFYISYDYVVRPSRFFVNRANLLFFKLNKPLEKNSLLRNPDVTPVNLVRQGTPAKVILRNRSLTLIGTAVPAQTGRLGDIIQLKVGDQKKILTGKIIDFNKVLVDL